MEDDNMNTKTEIINIAKEQLALDYNLSSP